MDFINGGVCAAKGFLANGMHCGIRKNKDKKDLALIVSEKTANAAAVYTQNLVQGAPLIVTKNNLSDNKAKAIICNSGNANTCNANGIEIAKKMCKELSNTLECDANDIIVASTGIIGQPLDITPIQNAIPALAEALGNKSLFAAEAIMTTDTGPKEIALSFEIDGKICTIGGIAKGSGMIHPNMATMLVFLTTDVNISGTALQQALDEDVKTSFNMISIDGDTSTNDMVAILANGMAENNEIITDSIEFKTFKQALNKVTTILCKMIAKDGEGATKLLECNVSGAKTEKDARLAAKSVICSSLVKTAMFGSDANWGRVLCAIGYSNANADVSKIDVSFKSDNGTILVCEKGSGVNFSEPHAKKILLCDEIQILVSLNDGDFSASAWGCDLTYDYVQINGDYRT